MAQPITPSPSTICPRCRSTTIEVQAQSPVAGVWTVFGCQTCRYAWRSTEAEQFRSADAYPATFRLRPEDLPHLPVIPTVPPLQQSGEIPP